MVVVVHVAVMFFCTEYLYLAVNVKMIVAGVVGTVAPVGQLAEVVFN